MNRDSKIFIKAKPIIQQAITQLEEKKISQKNILNNLNHKLQKINCKKISLYKLKNIAAKSDNTKCQNKNTEIKIINLIKKQTLCIMQKKITENQISLQDIHTLSVIIKNIENANKTNAQNKKIKSDSNAKMKKTDNTDSIEEIKNKIIYNKI